MCQGAESRRELVVQMPRRARTAGSRTSSRPALTQPVSTRPRRPPSCALSGSALSPFFAYHYPAANTDASSVAIVRTTTSLSGCGGCRGSGSITIEFTSQPLSTTDRMPTGVTVTKALRNDLRGDALRDPGALRDDVQDLGVGVTRVEVLIRGEYTTPKPGGQPRNDFDHEEGIGWVFVAALPPPSAPPPRFHQDRTLRTNAFKDDQIIRNRITLSTTNSTSKPRNNHG